ncbi:MAG: protease family protein [Microbacteriaceae bacterium]|jgi:membrane protease YdiL (CAAX protease family)|nr:protease family protein [Microbacteriaceae bacterium]
MIRSLAGVLLAASGVLLFALELRPAGYAVLAASIIAGFVATRALGKDIVLIAVGMVIMSLVPITTDISISHMIEMGAAMIGAVALPYLLSRYLYRERAIRFPIRTHQRWTKLEKFWLVLVVALGYLLLPVYMIHSGVYENWPAASDPGAVARLFLGVNALGIWDELFFICTVFTLLRRHFPDWQAIILQAVLFTSFLYELGFKSWGPLLIFPFAIVQGYTFKLTRSLTYIVCVHLLFDFVLFLVLLHAHDRSLVPIFVY